jgi:hypothetical protein
LLELSIVFLKELVHADDLLLFVGVVLVFRLRNSQFLHKNVPISLSFVKFLANKIEFTRKVLKKLSPVILAEV